MENDVDMNMANGSRAFPLHWGRKRMGWGLWALGGIGIGLHISEILLLISFHYAFAISAMNN